LPQLRRLSLLQPLLLPSHLPQRSQLRHLPQSLQSSPLRRLLAASSCRRPGHAPSTRLRPLLLELRSAAGLSLSVHGHNPPVLQVHAPNLQWLLALVAPCIPLAPSPAAHPAQAELLDVQALPLAHVRASLPVPGLVLVPEERQAAHPVQCPALAKSRECVLLRAQRHAAADSVTKRPRKAR
jgi:hypothetical protein